MFITFCNPDAYLGLTKKSKDKTERMVLYMMNQTIVYIKKTSDNMFDLLWIPTLPMDVGSFASFIGEMIDNKGKCEKDDF